MADKSSSQPHNISGKYSKGYYLGEKGKDGRYVLASRRGNVVPLTDKEAAFLRSKGHTVEPVVPVAPANPTDIPGQYSSTVEHTTAAPADTAGAVSPTGTDWTEVLADASVADVKSLVKEIKNPAELYALVAAEKAGKNRSTVLDAVDNKLAELK